MSAASAASLALELLARRVGVAAQDDAHATGSSSTSDWPCLTPSPAATSDLGDRRLGRRGQRHLHLHRLDHDQHLALGDGLAGGDAQLQDRARHRRLERALGAGGGALDHRLDEAEGEGLGAARRPTSSPSEAAIVPGPVERRR